MRPTDEEYMGELCLMTGLSREEVTSRALRQMHRDVSKGAAWKIAKQTLDVLARRPSDTDALAALQRLLHQYPELAEYRFDNGGDLLFYFVTHAWDEVLEGSRQKEENADSEADRAILAILLGAGMRPDRDALSTDVLRTPTFDGSLTLRRPTSVLRFLDDLSAWELGLEQRKWFVEQSDHADSALDRVERRGLGFNGEATVALVAGLVFTNVDPKRWNVLKAGAAERGLVLVPGGDLGTWRGLPVQAVMGIPVQVAYARTGPEEIERLELRNAIAAMSDLDFEWAGEGAKTARLQLVSPGPLASGTLAIGESQPSARRGDGTFIVGCDMEQEEHRLGVLGQRVAHAHWENEVIVTVAPEEHERLLDYAHRSFLVPDYD